MHLQLFEQLKSDITTNMRVGAKLPSIRKMANSYNISKTTVESAYSQLYAEGYIESRPKSGYYVSDFNLKEFKALAQPLKESQTPKQQEYRFDFFPAQLESSTFPLKLYKRLFNKAVNEELDFGSYGDGAGEAGLREAIAEYLQKSRGLHCSFEQIVISSSFIDSISLLARLIQPEHKSFAIEEPGYHIPRKLFASFGYKISKVALQSDGVDIEQLQKSGAKVLYITPSHQYPTGITMPIRKRQELIEYISSINGYILEDDYDSELNYTSRPIPALQGLDNRGCVIYLGTFAKSLSPALRVGYIVLPPKLLARYNKSFDKRFPRVSITTQKSLELFLKEGHHARHLRRIRTLNRKKHDLLKALLYKYLKDSFYIVAEGAGLAILIHPSHPFEWNKLVKECEKSGIKIYLAKKQSGDFEAVRMGFGGFKFEEIEEAVATFAPLWHSSFINK